ncbi:MAG: serine/threonine protein kinase [Acidobacteria bacterium]|nr:MAG: serine/threonine protein kinase [Acidobacteriota bacterium]
MPVREGLLLGRYRLLSRAGAGGMAEVWRAEDTGLHRTVAVKVVLDPIARDPAYVERFVREARLAAGLSHPNVLPVYDAGTADVDGVQVPFVVMPLVTGGSLKERIQGPVPFATAVAWLGALASALDHAHEQGILHRDVKPGNVLLDGTGRPLLADFGLARSAGAASGLTATGVVLGTPLYMAPEQAQGRPLDARADQYALAVIAFELLTGRVPFHADSPLAILHQHVTAPPARPSSVSQEIPPGVDAVMGRALAKEPAERFASCTEFVTALARALGAAAPTAPTQLLPEAPAPPAAPSRPLDARSATGALTVRSEERPPAPAAPVSAAGAPARRRLLVAACLVAAAGLAAFVASRAFLPRPESASPTPTPPPAASTPVPSPPPTPAPPTGATPIPALGIGVNGLSTSPSPGPPEAVPPTEPEPRPFPTRPSRREPPAATPPSPPAAATGRLVRPEPLLVSAELMGSSELATVWRSLDTTRAPGGRLPRAAFVDALGEVRRVLSSQDGREARFLGAYARGGVAFADGRTAEGWMLLGRALSMVPDRARLSRRMALVRDRLSAQGTPRGADTPWILGLAYGDVRGDLDEELTRALVRAPGNGVLLYARALASLDAGRQAGAEDAARRACDAGVPEACGMLK